MPTETSVARDTQKNESEGGHVRDEEVCAAALQLDRSSARRGCGSLAGGLFSRRWPIVSLCVWLRAPWLWLSLPPTGGLLGAGDQVQLLVVVVVVVDIGVVVSARDETPPLFPIGRYDSTGAAVVGMATPARPRAGCGPPSS